MARYRKHIISRGDTIQGIAQKYTGDTSYWKQVVEYNDLKYPYLVDTTAERQLNPEHVLTIGDTIVIPIEQNLLDVDVSSLGTRDKDLIMKLSLGMDLSGIGGGRRYQQHGTRDEVFELTANGRGDIALAVGVDNAKQAIIARLLTRTGSLINHPTYGSEIETLLGSPATSMTLKLVDDEILRTIKKDGRVSTANKVKSQIDNEIYSGEFEVTLYSIDELFTLVINNEEGIVDIT